MTLSPRRALAIVQPLFVVLAFVLLGFVLQRQWDVLRTHPWQIRPRWLLASALMIGGGWLVEIRMWQRLLFLFAGHLDYAAALRIWFPSAIVRYIPGNVWQPLSLTVLGQQRGVRPEATIASLSLFFVIHLLAVGPIAAAYLATWGRTSAFAYWLGGFSPWWAVVVGVPVVAMVVWPDALVAGANRLLSKAGRPPLVVALTAAQLLATLGLSFVAWACFAGGFAALAAAVMPRLSSGMLTVLPHLVAAYPIAFFVGFVSLLTPSGLLVRDGMLFLLLAPVIGKENSLIVSIAMRVWEIALDALATVAAIGIPGVATRFIQRKSG